MAADSPTSPTPAVAVCATCGGQLTHHHTGFTHTNNPTWLNCEEPVAVQQEQKT